MTLTEVCFRSDGSVWMWNAPLGTCMMVFSGGSSCRRFFDLLFWHFSSVFGAGKYRARLKHALRNAAGHSDAVLCGGFTPDGALHTLSAYVSELWLHGTTTTASV